MLVITHIIVLWKWNISQLLELGVEFVECQFLFQFELLLTSFGQFSGLPLQLK